MRVIAPRVLTVTVLLVATVAVVTWYRGDNRRLQAAVRELQTLAAKAGGESELAAANRARRIAALFAESFEVRAVPLNFFTSDRQSLMTAIMQYRARDESYRMRILERTIDRWMEDPGRAIVEFTAEFPGGLRLAGERYRFRLQWTDGTDGWKIERAELLTVEDRPGLL